MGKVRTTRRERRLQVNRVELYKPFIFHALVLAAMNAAALSGAGHSLAGACALVVAGLLSWGLIEYSIHRWVLHRKSTQAEATLPGNRTHLAHHEDPDSLARLNVQLSESIPICAVYCLLVWGLTGSWRSMTFMYDGLMLGYFFYEYLDFQAHHGAARGRVIRYFRKYHLQHHHYDATVRFGVTSPLFDYLFGTYHIDKRRARVGVLSRGES